MPLEKPSIQIRIGTAEFELATVAEAISLLPARRRRAKAVNVKKGEK